MIIPLFIALATTLAPTSIITPSIIPSSVPISDEIQKIREVVQQKVREKLKQITEPATTKKGIIGKVIQTSTTEITIDYQNSTRTLIINSDTVYVDAKRNKSSLDKLKIGQDILAMGIKNTSDNTFEAKRVVFTDAGALNVKKTATIGKIVDISKSSSIFTLIPSNNKNSLFQIKTDSKTVVINEEQKKLSLNDLKSGHKVIVIMSPDEKVTKTYYAEKIIDFDYESQSALQTPTPTKKQ